MADSKFWEGSEIRAKLSILRLDAVRALEEHLALKDEVSAIGFVTAQAKYTLACAEAQNDSILDYVDTNTL